MFQKIMPFLADETHGQSYKAHKYNLDNAERPAFDYDGKETTWRNLAETEIRRGYTNLAERCKQLSENEDQIISFFLDGSRRVFKVDDIAYSIDGKRKQIFPVIAGQIGVGCCRRINKQMHCERFLSEIVLAVPEIACASGSGQEGFFRSLATKISQNCAELQRRGLSVSAIYPYSIKDDGKKREDKGTSKVQDRMIILEQEMVAQLVREHRLGQNGYLIKDGSLEYLPEYSPDKQKYKRNKQNYRWVLGLSKQFNAELCHDEKGKVNPGFIAELPPFSRTPVAKYDCSKQSNSMLGDIQFAVWYIRLRDKNRTRSPFDGVLKVEKILVTDDEIAYGMDSELVDTLSAYLINERTPTSYGADLRWANHIYPIYLTELYVKSQYISTPSFLQLF